MNRQFTEEDIQMASKNIKKCSNLPIIRDMSVKTTPSIEKYLLEWLK